MTPLLLPLLFLASVPWFITHASEMIAAQIYTEGLNLVLQSLVGGSLIFNGVDVMMQISTLQSQYSLLLNKTIALESLVVQLQANASSAKSDTLNLQSDSATQAKLIIGIQSNISTLQSNDNSQSLTLASLQSNVVGIQSNVSTVQASVTSQSGLISTCHANVSSLQTSVNGVFGNVFALQSNVVGLQVNVSTVQGSVASQSGLISITQANISSLQTSINGVFDNVSKLQSNVSSQALLVAAVQNNVSVVQSSIAAQSNLISGIQAITLSQNVSLTLTQSNVSAQSLVISGVQGNISQLSSSIPIGSIILWSGSVTAIPKFFALCNGQTINGTTTPNLSGQFVVGVGTNSQGASYSIGQIGGHDSQSFNVTVGIIDSSYPGGCYQTWIEGDLGTTCGTVPSGVTSKIPTSITLSTLDNRPSFYALAYIMRYQ